MSLAPGEKIVGRQALVTPIQNESIEARICSGIEITGLRRAEVGEKIRIMLFQVPGDRPSTAVHEHNGADEDCYYEYGSELVMHAA